MRLTSLLALSLLCGVGFAEELDVLTLRTGRVVEGHYDEKNRTMYFTGKMSGGLKVDPGDILKREKRTIADEPKVAPAAPAASPTKDPADPALAGKRAASANAIKRSQMQKDLQSSVDYQRLYETNIAKMQSEQQELPKKLDSLRPRIDRARADYENAQSRYTSVQQEYDYWNSNYYRTRLGYSGASVADARQQRDRAQLALKNLQDEETKTQKRIDGVGKEIIDNQTPLKASIEKQATLKADLAKLDAQEADAPLPGAEPERRQSVPTPVPTPAPAPTPVPPAPAPAPAPGGSQLP